MSQKTDYGGKSWIASDLVAVAAFKGLALEEQLDFDGSCSFENDVSDWRHRGGTLLGVEEPDHGEVPVIWSDLSVDSGEYK